MAGVTALIAGVASSAYGAISAGNQSKRSRKAAEERARELKRLQSTRQDIINPYDNMENLSGLASDVSGMASDLGGMIDNHYENMGVATQAAEFQAQEADLSLANSLDAMQSSGASAGGATALANAAMRSKQGISASLEQQEASNQQMRAQGAMATQNIRMSEAKRIQETNMSEAMRMQNINIAEGTRMQNAEVAGRTFEWNAKENREVSEMNRVAGQEANHRQNASNAQARQTEAIMGGISGLASGITGMAGENAAANRAADVSSNATGKQGNSFGGFNASDTSGFEYKPQSNFLK